MERSKIKVIATIFFCGYLVASCFANAVKAEDVVTGNILPNAGNSVSSYNSGTTPVISDNTSDTTMSNNTTLDGLLSPVIQPTARMVDAAHFSITIKQLKLHTI